MGWIRISDDFYDHEKFYDVTALGMAAWITGLAFANRNLTDGYVRARAVPGLVSVDGIDIDLSTPGALAGAGREATWKDAVDELVAAGLWHEPGHDCPDCPEVRSGEFYIHGYLDYQPSKDAIAAKTEATRKRVAAFREKRKREKQASNSVGNGERNGGVTAHPNPNPNTYVDGSGPEVSQVSAPQVSSEIADANSRPDVEHLLDVLDDAIVANGSKRPARNKRNRDAMRLLIDRDHRTPMQIEACIAWCQNDGFWRTNILSASKLRDRYDQLRLDAQRQRDGTTRSQTPTERAIATAQAGARVQAELDSQSRKAIA